MRLRAAAIAVPSFAVLLAVSSCSAIPEDWRTPAFLETDRQEIDDRLPEVSGEFGTEPEVDFSGKAPPQEQVSGVVEKGDGENDLIRGGDIVQADVVEYQWTAEGKAEQTQSTYEADAPILLNLGQLQENLTESLVNQPVGTRVVYAFPPQDPEQAQQQGQPSPEPGSSVSVLDIRKRYGEAEVVPGQQDSEGGDGLPTVEQSGHDQPDITVPEDTDPPAEMRTEALIQGDGPEVEAGQQLVVQYTGVQWNNGEEFDSTWSREGAEGVPATFLIGDGQVIEGWDEGLVGANVGSRMLLVVPPDLAYGDSAAQQGAPEGTLVFVIDILDAVNSAPQEEQGDGSGEGSGEGSGDGSGSGDGGGSDDG
ncbi:FKBP-type peptidyl-prolyl cis-trans isomerase [Streptomonospora salina]|uniref:peptidylprolyl isomerase n=1 Tax=Streptomonospora salina TaxID=104205 RepID=A0A841E5D7_9ACTN|nr:FKBP-type peptidyl-prolyl cis-trans isomerase [Streptomonospora salina]MBB5996408.1 peptidylprolyl isomerase [Streptomonospora salina]